jgi:hypothetical protein
MSFLLRRPVAVGFGDCGNGMFLLAKKKAQHPQTIRDHP